MRLVAVIAPLTTMPPTGTTTEGTGSMTPSTSRTPSVVAAPTPMAIHAVERPFGSSLDRPAATNPAITTIPATHASAPSSPARVNRIVRRAPTASSCTKARNAAHSSSRVRPRRAHMEAPTAMPTSSTEAATPSQSGI